MISYAQHAVLHKIWGNLLEIIINSTLKVVGRRRRTPLTHKEGKLVRKLSDVLIRGIKI